MALLQTAPVPNPMGTPGGNPNVMGTPGGNLGAQGGNFGAPANVAPVKASANNVQQAVSGNVPAAPQSIFSAGGIYGPPAVPMTGVSSWNNPTPTATAAAPATPDAYTQATDALLQQLQSSGYTPAETIGGGSSVVQTGPGLEQIMSMLGLGNYQAPTLAALTSQADNQVNTTLNPQIAAVQQQIAARNTLGAQQSGDEAKNYADLASYIQAATQQGQNAYGQAANAQGQDYDSLIQGIGQNYANGKQAVNAEQSRLGLTGINNSSFDRDAQFLQGLAGVNKQAAANTLAGQQANYTGSQNLLGSAEQSGGAAAQTKLAATLAAALGGLNQQESSLEGSRGGLQQQALAALQQQALTNQNSNTTQMLDAIKAAAAGQKVVSNGSTKIAASGINDQQKFTDAMAILNGQSSHTAAQVNAAAKTAAQYLAQVNSATSTTKEQQALAGTPGLATYNNTLAQIAKSYGAS